MELFWHAPLRNKENDTSHRAAPTSRRKAQLKDSKSTSTKGKKLTARPTGERNKNMQALLQQQATNPVRHAISQTWKPNRFRPVWTHVFSSLLYKIDQVRLLTIEVHLFTDWLDLPPAPQTVAHALVALRDVQLALPLWETRTRTPQLRYFSHLSLHCAAGLKVDFT